MCEHLDELSSGRARPVQPSGDGCKECLESGGTWVQLRLCTACGHVGCCDSSPNHHATRHFHAMGHPVIRSFEPGERWAWCYVHEETVRDVPDSLEAAPSRHDAPPSA